jgi:hypothetical protein
VQAVIGALPLRHRRRLVFAGPGTRPAGAGVERVVLSSRVGRIAAVMQVQPEPCSMPDAGQGMRLAEGRPRTWRHPGRLADVK